MNKIHGSNIWNTLFIKMNEIHGSNIWNTLFIKMNKIHGSNESDYMILPPFTFLVIVASHVHAMTLPKVLHRILLKLRMHSTIFDVTMNL
jgi:hypothetical protein